jgi:hypothetical protein
LTDNTLTNNIAINDTLTDDTLTNNIVINDTLTDQDTPIDNILTDNIAINDTLTDNIAINDTLTDQDTVIDDTLTEQDTAIDDTLTSNTIKIISNKRGAKIDIKWYMSDFTSTNKLKIWIVHDELKGDLSEITELCKIIYESNLDNVKYLYIIFNSYSKSYEFYILFNKQLKDYNKARLRFSIYNWNNNCDYKVENNKMTNTELTKYISSYTNELIYVHCIKPIFHKSNNQSSRDKLRKLVIRVMNKLNIKVKYMSNTLVDCNYNAISITDAMYLIHQDALLKNASIKSLYEIFMELEFKNGFGNQFIRGLYPVYKP